MAPDEDVYVMVIWELCAADDGRPLKIVDEPPPQLLVPVAVLVF